MLVINLMNHKATEQFSGKKDGVYRMLTFDRLRKHDQVKHYIYHVLRHEVPKAVSWCELRRALRRYKIDTEFKLNRRTGEAEGVKFICNGYKFSGSKIDRQFSFVNIACRLEENAFDAGICQDATALLPNSARSLARRYFVKSQAKRVASVPACSTSLPPLPPIPKRRCWQSNM